MIPLYILTKISWEKTILLALSYETILKLEMNIFMAIT
jgi:hypothetical protein